MAERGEQPPAAPPGRAVCQDAVPQLGPSSVPALLTCRRGSCLLDRERHLVETGGHTDGPQWTLWSWGQVAC